jgi:hypothetical protein
MTALDELRARWLHEIWLPQSHKSSGELVVSDDARVSSRAGASPGGTSEAPRLSKEQGDSARVAAWRLHRFVQDRTQELIFDRAMLDRGWMRE